MPVFTAAVVAVTAAIATTTVATVATAAVAVSAAIGVAGLGVTAVGAITGNKDLLKAGKIMGYIGLAGGLVGGAIGGVGALASGGSFIDGAASAFSGAAQYTSDAASSYMDNISNFFNPETASQVMGAQQEAMGTGIVAGTNPQAGQAMFTGGMDQAALGKGIAAGTSGALPPGSTAASFAPGITAPTISGPDPFQVQSPISPGPATPSALNGPDPFQVSAPVAPVQPGVPVAPTAAGATQQALGQGIVQGTMGATAGTPTTAAGLWASMPDYMKYAAMTTGMQGVTGLASGYYQGLSAEEQLNFQKLMNQQNQNQVQYLNKNNAYAPLVTFGQKPTTGLINR